MVGLFLGDGEGDAVSYFHTAQDIGMELMELTSELKVLHKYSL